jgi:hypothetical protein
MGWLIPFLRLIYSKKNWWVNPKNRLCDSNYFFGVHRLRRRDEVDDLESTVTGFKLKDYLKIRLLSFVFKILHVRHPSYIFSLFHFSTSQRTRGLQPPVHLSLAMDQSFVRHAVTAWNGLPYNLKSLESHSGFLAAIRTTIPR